MRRGRPGILRTRSQTPFGNARSRNSVSRWFPSQCGFLTGNGVSRSGFPNGVWEPEGSGPPGLWRYAARAAGNSSNSFPNSVWERTLSKLCFALVPEPVRIPDGKRSFPEWVPKRSLGTRRIWSPRPVALCGAGGREFFELVPKLRLGTHALETLFRVGSRASADS